MLALFDFHRNWKKFSFKKYQKKQRRNQHWGGQAIKWKLSEMFGQRTEKEKRKKATTKKT